MYTKTETRSTERGRDGDEGRAEIVDDAQTRDGAGEEEGEVGEYNLHEGWRQVE